MNTRAVPLILLAAATEDFDMKISRRHATIGGLSLLAGTSINTSTQAKRERPLRDAIESAKEREQVRDLASRTVYRRAVDAVIWGLPLVGQDAVKQAAFRDGKANYNDIVWWPKGGGWKNQSPTPNVNTRYMYFFINTRQDGPVVVEIPPAVSGAGFYGTIEDAWYVPLIDLGFEGNGGKYLVLPPDYKGDVPDGYVAVRPNTFNTMTLLRSILASLTEADVKAGNGLVQQVKIYPPVEGCQPARAAFARHDRRFVQRSHQLRRNLLRRSRPRVERRAGAAPRPPNDEYASAAWHREGQGVQAGCSDRRSVESGGSGSAGLANV
jgi:Protein of unknown function (DUF1254)